MFFKVLSLQFWMLLVEWRLAEPILADVVMLYDAV